jgi:hypothetical protein
MIGRREFITLIGSAATWPREIARSDSFDIFAPRLSSSRRIPSRKN